MNKAPVKSVDLCDWGSATRPSILLIMLNFLYLNNFCALIIVAQSYWFLTLLRNIFATTSVLNVLWASIESGDEVFLHKRLPLIADFCANHTCRH